LTHLNDDAIIDVYDSASAMRELLAVAGEYGVIRIERD
jgi:hypothetical protein